MSAVRDYRGGDKPPLVTIESIRSAEAAYRARADASMARALAAIRIGARRAVHSTIVRIIRAMLDDARQFDRVQPGLSEMLPADRAEHCRALWHAHRDERRGNRAYSDPIFGRTDTANLRAAYVAAWIVERRERRQARRDLPIEGERQTHDAMMMEDVP
jgi:hypothetical protein